MSTRQLQDRLEHAAQALPDPAMATLEEVRERANSRRRRRWTLTAAASLSAVVLIGVAGVNLLPQGPDSPVIEPVGQDPQVNRPSEPSRDPETNGPPRQIASEVAADGSVAVANGSFLGAEWSLRARHSHGVVCLELDDGSGGTGTQCTAPVEPSEIRFGSSQAGEQTPVFVLGQVGNRVASVDVSLATGGPVQAEIFEVDGLPVNAYVAVLPPGSRPTEVVARNRFGLKIASSS